MADQNFSNDSNNQIDPLLTSDPLAAKTDDASADTSQNTPIPLIQESPTSSPSADTGFATTSPPAAPEPAPPELNTPTPSSNKVTTPENQDEARTRANELMDQGKFSEAAKILKESGIHKTKIPKPQPQESSQDTLDTTPSVSEPPTVPNEDPTTQTTEPSITPTPVPSEPMPPAPQEISPEPPTISEQPQVTTDQPLNDQSSDISSQQSVEPTPTSITEDKIPPPPEQPEPPKPTPPGSDMLNGQAVPEETPDDYLKKAYNIRKGLLEYDRIKVAEEEKLQAAEELVFEGNKEKAIEIYKQVAHEAEEKQEQEVAIEAYERLAALTR
ncbi:MAG: hypothetical protein ABH837_03805 [bacterium]